MPASKAKISRRVKTSYRRKFNIGLIVLKNYANYKNPGRENIVFTVG